MTDKALLHYDLFAGIGGFSLAIDNIFKNYERKHIFCEWEDYPTAVLKKHWPDGTYYGDIADLVADTASIRQQGQREYQRPSDTAENTSKETDTATNNNTVGLTILTGGFPCQPFSHAGRRQGTADDRYKWPEMFAVIRNVRPDWVVAENVRGLVTWNEGMVLETVCANLESEGYEVQPFVIPACAIGAPHRRDRVWILARNKTSQWQGDDNRQGGLGANQGLQMDDVQDGLRADKDKQEDGTSTSILNERTEGDGRRPHQSQPARQSQKQPESRPSLLEYTQQEEAGWSEFAEGEELLESVNLCKQPENKLGAIVQDGGRSEIGLRESKEGVRLVDTATEKRGIVAHAVNGGQRREERRGNETQDSLPQEHRAEDGTARELERTVSNGMFNGHAPNPRQQLREQGGGEGVEANTTIRATRSETNQREHQYTWADDWREVAFATCHDGVDDGLPRRMGGVTISAAKHRKEQLKAYGNAIVPQVAEIILHAIKLTYES